jgi:hypothetical protein
MNKIKIGMVAAMAIALLTPAVALAQAAPRIDANQRKKGMAEAPALITAAGSKCVLADAVYVGGSNEAKTKTKTDFTEVACTGNLGVVFQKVVSPEGEKVQGFNCLALAEPMADGKPNNLKCRLPGNLNPATGMQAFVTSAGVTCNVDKARALGEGATAAYFEVGCDNNRGYIVETGKLYDPAGVVKLSNCLLYEEGGNVTCKLTPRAAQLEAALNPLVPQADETCQVKDRRYVLTSGANEDYFEVSCNDGKGFMIRTDNKGAFKEKVECANADHVAGGCSLTDVKTAKTEDNALYTRLAKAGGYDCDVKGYRSLTASRDGETVELECSNRADGAIAIFPAGGGKVRAYNCAAADLTGFRCNLTKAPATYALLTAAVKKSRPTSTCTVSDAKFMGANTDAGFVEVACSDREPGYVLRYPKATDVSDAALYCTQARTDLGTSCTLPTNVTPAR